MAARILEVCDAVAARLRGLTPGLAVERVYAVTLDPPPATRTVYVLPAGYGQAETASRGADANDLRVWVVVVAPSDALPPPTAWVDEQVAFVEQSVYGPLQEARDDAASLDAGELLPWAAEVSEVFDPDALAAGLFVSELQLTYREYAAAG